VGPLHAQPLRGVVGVMDEVPREEVQGGRPVALPGRPPGGRREEGQRPKLALHVLHLLGRSLARVLLLLELHSETEVTGGEEESSSVPCCRGEKRAFRLGPWKPGPTWHRLHNSQPLHPQ